MDICNLDLLLSRPRGPRHPCQMIVGSWIARARGCEGVAALTVSPPTLIRVTGGRRLMNCCPLHSRQDLPANSRHPCDQQKRPRGLSECGSRIVLFHLRSHMNDTILEL